MHDDTQGEYYIDYEKAESWGYDPVIGYHALTAYGDRLYYIRVSSNISSLCRIDLRENHSDVIKTFDGRSYDGFFGDISNVMRYGKYLFFPNGEKLDMENEQVTPIFSDYMQPGDNYDIQRVLVGVEANHLYYLEYKGDALAGLFRRHIEGQDAEAVPIKTSKVLPEDVLTAVAIRRGYGCICNGMLWICSIDAGKLIAPLIYLGKIDLATGETACVYAPAFDENGHLNQLAAFL